MNIFVKLGDTAHSFSDPISGFSIIKGEVLILNDISQKSSKIKNALKGGHLVRSSKSEYDAYRQALSIGKKTVIENSGEKELKAMLKSEQKRNEELLAELEVLKLKLSKPEPEDKSQSVEFSSLSEDELTEYYIENFEATEKQINAFKKLSKEKKVEQLEELESE